MHSRRLDPHSGPYSKSQNNALRFEKKSFALTGIVRFLGAEDAHGTQKALR